MRKLKFRAWVKDKEVMAPAKNIYELHELLHSLFCADITQFLFLQYTGLNDKNGKEIYEGDIIDTKHRGIEVVELHQEYDLVGYPLCYESGTVIGNIYENPELLEK